MLIAKDYSPPFFFLTTPLLAISPLFLFSLSFKFLSIKQTNSKNQKKTLSTVALPLPYSTPIKVPDGKLEIEGFFFN
ncbi:hypothetical protein V6N13_043943 [Hibiscus sabdariffa]|uniref:Uncharacterized protein n=1 Tax=Hibiscus sabdariffa TaxID=183260 RepID=A0ABR2RGQ4_9ROSI